MTPHGFSPLGVSFVLDTEELHQQWELAQVFSETLGSAVEIALVEVSDLRTALGVACGVGGWSLHLAQAAPSVQVIGIDDHPEYVTFARQMAQ